MEGVCQADYLIIADQVIPGWLVKDHIPGEAKTAVRLGIKSWFAGMGLGISDCIFALLSLF